MRSTDSSQIFWGISDADLVRLRLARPTSASRRCASFRLIPKITPYDASAEDAASLVAEVKNKSRAVILSRAVGRPTDRWRIQAVVATGGVSGSNSSRCRACAGVMPPRVLRGRSLSSAATSSSRWDECTDRSVLLGKYWRSNPFVFSLDPRCHAGLPQLVGRFGRGQWRFRRSGS
jgi:hypothetical protein